MKVVNITPSYWKEVAGQYWDKVLVWVRKVYGYWWMVVTFEWILSNFLKLSTICSHRLLLKILLVSHNGVFLVQWYLKNLVINFIDFCFPNRYKKKKFRLRSLVGHGYVSLNVTQQNLLMMFVIFFQRHLLAYQLKFVFSQRLSLKKILKEIREFCNILLYFVICYWYYKGSSLQSVFFIFYLPTFIHK